MRQPLSQMHSPSQISTVRGVNGQSLARFGNARPVIEPLCSHAIAPQGLPVRLTVGHDFMLSMSRPG